MAGYRSTSPNIDDFGDDLYKHPRIMSMVVDVKR